MNAEEIQQAFKEWEGIRDWIDLDQLCDKIIELRKKMKEELVAKLKEKFGDDAEGIYDEVLDEWLTGTIMDDLSDAMGQQRLGDWDDLNPLLEWIKERI